MWHLFDQPHLLFRGYELEIMTAIFIVGGTILGFFFGLIVNGMVKREHRSINVCAFYVGMMVFGAMVYSSFYWITLRFRLPLFLAADAVLFFAGLIVAYYLLKCKRHKGLQGTSLQSAPEPCRSVSNFLLAVYCH